MVPNPLLHYSIFRAYHPEFAQLSPLLSVPFWGHPSDSTFAAIEPKQHVLPITIFAIGYCAIPRLLLLFHGRVQPQLLTIAPDIQILTLNLDSHFFSPSFIPPHQTHLFLPSSDSFSKDLTLGCQEPSLVTDPSRFITVPSLSAPPSSNFLRKLASNSLDILPIPSIPASDQ